MAKQSKRFKGSKGVKNTLKLDLILRCYQLRAQGLTHQQISDKITSEGNPVSKQRVTQYLSKAKKESLAKRGIFVN